MSEVNCCGNLGYVDAFPCIGFVYNVCGAVKDAAEIYVWVVMWGV